VFEAVLSPGRGPVIPEPVLGSLPNGN
jgi:hypothetical protein